MKKIFAFIAAAFMAISVSAQSEAGSFTLQPNVGFTYSTATGDGGKSVDGAFGLTAGVTVLLVLLLVLKVCTWSTISSVQLSVSTTQATT